MQYSEARLYIVLLVETGIKTLVASEVRISCPRRTHLAVILCTRVERCPTAVSP